LGRQWADWSKHPETNLPSDLRFYVERVTGIEPALSAWEADVRWRELPSIRPGQKADCRDASGLDWGRVPQTRPNGARNLPGNARPREGRWGRFGG